MADKTLHTHAQLKQESAGKIVEEKAPGLRPSYTPEELRVADETIGIIQLISGTTAKGEDFYAYVSIRPSLYEEFMGKMMGGERMDVEKFGNILKKGFGAKPSDDVKKYMEETFGVDHNFMRHLAEEVQKLQQDKK